MSKKKSNCRLLVLCQIFTLFSKLVNLTFKLMSCVSYMKAIFVVRPDPIQALSNGTHLCLIDF